MRKKSYRILSKKCVRISKLKRGLIRDLIWLLNCRISAFELFYTFDNFVDDIMGNFSGHFSGFLKGFSFRSGFLSFQNCSHLYCLNFEINWSFDQDKFCSIRMTNHALKKWNSSIWLAATDQRQRRLLTLE